MYLPKAAIASVVLLVRICQTRAGNCYDCCQYGNCAAGYTCCGCDAECFCCTDFETCNGNPPSVKCIPWARSFHSVMQASSVNHVSKLSLGMEMQQDSKRIWTTLADSFGIPTPIHERSPVAAWLGIHMPSKSGETSREIVGAVLFQTDTCSNGELRWYLMQDPVVIGDPVDCDRALPVKRRQILQLKLQRHGSDGWAVSISIRAAGNSTSSTTTGPPLLSYVHAADPSRTAGNGTGLRTSAGMMTTVGFKPFEPDAMLALQLDDKGTGIALWNVTDVMLLETGAPRPAPAETWKTSITYVPIID